MKKRKKTTHKAPQGMTRREFVGGALATAGIITGAPAFLRGQNLNSKLNIAMIACGGRAGASMSALTIVAGGGGRAGGGGGAARAGGGGANAAAAGAAPAAGAAAGGGRRGAAAAGPAAPHPDENITVLCDVNQNAVDSAALRYPQAKKFNDMRRVFDSPNDFDAVVVATAEQGHVYGTYLALTHGKHVYCEKPLAYNIFETRLVRETAAKYPKLSTQMGNQGHADEARRTVREILMTGVIGPVHEVHVWADRAWGLQDAASATKFDMPHGFYNGVQIVDRFKEEMPTPPTNHFDLWLGGAPVRPFHATYFPGPRWYRWWDFGNGTMSDLGSHDNDVPYTVLDLFHDVAGKRVMAPATIESVSPSGPAHKELAPATLQATYEFAAVGNQPALKLVWHQGDSKPPGWKAEPAWTRGAGPVGIGRGHLFIGSKGMLLGTGTLLDLNGNPEPFKDFQMPAPTLPRSPGHWVEWVNYAKGNTSTPPGSNFQYSGWTTEANHLGNVAYRTGKKIQWDYANMRATNAPEAAPFIKRPVYRKGWGDIIGA